MSDAILKAPLDVRRSRAMLTGVVLAVLLGLLVCIGWQGLRLFERGLAERIDAQAAAAATAVVDALDRLQDRPETVVSWLETELANRPALDYLVVTDRAGAIRLAAGAPFAAGAPPALVRHFRAAAASGTDAAEAVADGSFRDIRRGVGRPEVGFVHAGTAAGPVARQVRNVTVDLVVVVFVVAILGYELLHLGLAILVGAPLDTLARLTGCGRFTGTPETVQSVERRLAFVRIAFFLIVFAEAFCLSFLPIQARRLYAPIPGLSEEMAISLPAAAFWLMVALAQVTTGLWEGGRDRRRLFAATAGLVGLGLAGCGAAQDLHHLVLARALAGVGYGAAMILAQDCIIGAMAPERRTLSAGLYLRIFFGGLVCGTLIGGVIADHLDYAATFGVSALIALAAVPFALRLDPEPAAAPARRPLRLAGLFGNRRFLAVLALSAFPSRLLIGAFLYYLAPLYLDVLEVGKPEAARVMTIFPLVMVAGLVGSARLIDRLGRPLLFAAAGNLLSALAMVLVPLWRDDLWGVVGAITLLGIAQAFGMSPQLTTMFQVTEAECARYGRTTVLGVFRVCERLGSVAGPLAAAGLAGHFGYFPAFLGTGALILTATAAMLTVFAFTQDRHRQDEPLPRGEAPP